MSLRLKVSKSLAAIIFLGLLITPAYGHSVKVSEDVGGTLHIEPNDNPKAGETAQAWFALTRKGGKIIPLEKCNCQLAVYSKPHAEGSIPLLKPSLKPISASQYQGIPGAEILFPKAGTYELEISGTPKADANFKPFKLNFTVNVAAGTPVAAIAPSPKKSSQINQNKESGSQWYMPAIVSGVAILGGGLVWSVLRRRK